MIFDRSRTDTSSDLAGVTIELTLADGETLQGKLVMPASKSPADVIHGPSAFLEVAPFGGQRQFIAKSGVRAVRLVQPPRAVLGDPLRDLDGFDPYRVLGITAEASWEEVRHAYLALSKTYHPDRYATAELPSEIAEYLAGMSRRINAAYEALETARERVVRQRERLQPIYETSNRRPVPLRPRTPAAAMLRPSCGDTQG